MTHLSGSDAWHFEINHLDISVSAFFITWAGHAACSREAFPAKIFRGCRQTDSKWQRHPEHCIWQHVGAVRELDTGWYPYKFPVDFHRNRPDMGGTLSRKSWKTKWEKAYNTWRPSLKQTELRLLSRIKTSCLRNPSLNEQIAVNENVGEPVREAKRACNWQIVYNAQTDKNTIPS